jgi:hypothetical protein
MAAQRHYCRFADDESRLYRPTDRPLEVGRNGGSIAMHALKILALGVTLAAAGGL